VHWYADARFMTTRYEPTTTYRLQFGTHFGFADAQRLIPYLDQIGITTCYSSPLLKAAAGSTHGYDICDHRALNQELGTDPEFEAFARDLKARGIGLVLDFVPNHMGLDASANPWWRDVLQHGEASPFANFFDIDWDPMTPELKGRILLPILQDGYGEVLERGELTLGFDAGELQLHYFDRRLPIEPGSALVVLKKAVGADARSAVADQTGQALPDWDEYSDILNLLERLPPVYARDPAEQRTRHDITDRARERLASLVERAPQVGASIARVVACFNGTPGQPATFDQLHDLLDRQPYRVAHWKTSFDEINYRRFFDINDLGAIRMEDPRVFKAAHQKILQLVAAGHVTGLRIDHPDGLHDPASYFHRLAHETSEALSRAGLDEPPARFYIVAEKILARGEFLPDSWPVAGTTGYGFLNALNGVFVDAENAEALRRGYVRITGRSESFDEVACQAQRLVMGSAMASELGVLSHALKAIALSDRRTRDFTVTALNKTIVEVVANLRCYRTYISDTGFSPADREMTDDAVDRARRSNPVMAQSLFMFLRNVLLADGPASGRLPALRQFAMKFQQYSAPVQAKGLEDTSFYRYNVLMSLNEVGGDPSRFGTAPDEFHGGNRVRLERWPRELTATATHDTKRGEDARARLNVLSESPALWRHSVAEWRKINAGHRTAVDRASAPDANDEYLFYQALVSTWPAEHIDAPLPAEASPDLVARLRGYMQKAIKEAKTHTSWFNQGGAYEDAVARFVETTLRGSAAKRFLKSFVPFVRRVSVGGMVNSLAQLVLKAAAPGVPDFYQGTEFWQLDLADPDNRRPVDFRARESALAALMPWIERAERPLAVETCGCDSELEAFVGDLLADWPDARIKMFVMACALRLRRSESTLFIDGTYEPLRVEGAEAPHLLGFTRTLGQRRLIAAVPRLMNHQLPEGRQIPIGADVWKDTRLFLSADAAGATLRHVFTGARLKTDESRSLLAADLFRTCPVALLVTE
jgi:(1->4)-alpha-D-glucan 1-alpha-D-glucosylmutase